ncbi:MAG: hypothetical protein E6Q98_19910 [Rhodospirillaceae bacterium]|nr:MAG: hypothetical protein E6Q98_19910 [Rhodospirillaceae bacterium]
MSSTREEAGGSALPQHMQEVIIRLEADRLTALLGNLARAVNQSRDEDARLIVLAIFRLAGAETVEIAQMKMVSAYHHGAHAISLSPAPGLLGLLRALESGKRIRRRDLRLWFGDESARRIREHCDQHRRNALARDLRDAYPTGGTEV